MRKEGKREYFPSVLDRLFKRLEIEDDPDELKDDVESIAYHFFDYLCRMNEDERLVITSFFRFGCPGEMPKNIHMHTDLLERHTNFNLERLKMILRGIDYLGFVCSMRYETHHHEGNTRRLSDGHHMFVLEWSDLRSVATDVPAMEVASGVIREISSHYCEVHGNECFDRLDFSQLSSFGVLDRKKRSAN